jgi:hypothetical protein
MLEVQRDPEATVIYILCIALTAPIIITGLLRGSAIGAGTTISMMIAAAGVFGLAVTWRRRVRLPRARVYRHRRTSQGRAGLSSTSRNR